MGSIDIDIDVWNLRKEISETRDRLEYVNMIKSEALEYIRQLTREGIDIPPYNIHVSKDRVYKFYIPLDTDGNLIFQIVGNIADTYDCFVAISFSNILLYRTHPDNPNEVEIREAIHVFTYWYDDDDLREDEEEYFSEYYEKIDIMGVFDLNKHPGLHGVEEIYIPPGFIDGFII